MGKPDDEKEPKENDMCMDKPRSNGDAAPSSSSSVRDRAKALAANKYSLVIIILCILVFILFIVIIALAVQLGAKLPETVPYCDTSGCMSIASKLKSGLDQSVDPCENFWKYSCGGWMEEHPLPDSRGSYSVGDRTTDDVYLKLRHLIDIIPENSEKHFTPEMKIKKFYSTCINENFIDRDNAIPLTQIISKLQGWYLFGSFIAARFDKQRTLQELQVEYGVTPYFKIDVIPDPKDSIGAIIKISQSGLGVSDASMYFRSLDDPHVQAYRGFIKDLLRLFESSSPNLSKFIDNIYYYEKRIAEVSLSPQEEMVSVGSRLTMEELSKVAPGVDWLSLLQNYFNDASISATTEVIVQSKRYLKDISNIISSSDTETVNNYMIWKLVAHYSKFLSKNFRNVHNTYHQKLSGATHPKKRWHQCIDEVNEYFGFAISALYIDKYYSSSAKDDMESILKNVIQTVSRQISNLRWMDGKTKERAQNKVQEISTMIAFPSFIQNYKVLTDYYQPFVVFSTNYFKNILLGTQFKKGIQEKFLIEGFDGSYNFPSLPQDHQPFYSLGGNSITLPFGVIELETYSESYPLSVKYGSLGSLVAKQIIRSIDELGSSYNVLGNEEKWWTNTTRDKYNKMKNCLIHYYNGYKVDGIKINGNLTVTNNIDDAAGLKQAYQAFLDRSSDEKALPGLGLSPKQQFFVSHAQTMCQNIRQEELRTSNNTCLMAPNKIRLEAVTSLLSEFNDAFDCPYRTPYCKF